MSQGNGVKKMYMTTDEFAELIVDILDSSNYFKRGVKAHPEDIMFAFVPAAEAVVESFKHFSKKMLQEQAAEKNSALNYSEEKYKSNHHK